MDFLNLIAEAAKEPATTMFDMAFVKWLAGFLVAGYAPLLYYLKGLLDQRKKLLEDQVVAANERSGLTEKIRKELEDEIRKRFMGIISVKDAEIEKHEAELNEMRRERLHMLTKQIEDGHKQETSLEKCTEDYNELVEEFKPLLRECVKLLHYYKKKREGH